MSTEKTQVIEILGEPRTCVVLERKARSSDAVITSFVPVFGEDESVVDWLTRLFGGSVEKTRNAIIRDIIRPAAIEATAAALSADGQFSPLKFTEALASWGEPSSRRAGGPSLADLRERLAQISPRFLQLVGLMRSNPAGFVGSPEGLEFARLFEEQRTINDAISAKEGAPKKPRKAKKKAAAATEAAEAAEPAVN